VEAASRTLSHYLRPGATVIVESTSYPGTMQEQVLRWLEEVSGLTAGTDFHLGYSPERIDPGNRPGRWSPPRRNFWGIDADSLAAVRDFYAGIADETVAVSSPREAEGGHRRGVHQAVRVHAVQSRAGAGGHWPASARASPPHLTTTEADTDRLGATARTPNE
jgi:hypothetical protein